MNATLKNITAMLVFGSIGLFVRNIEIASSQIALVRGFIGAFVLFIAMICLHKTFNRQALIKNLRYLLIAGIAIGLNWIFLFQAYNYTTIATATLTYYLAPTFVVLLSPFVLKESLSTFKIICVVLSLLGMALVAGIFNDNQSGTNDFIGAIYGTCAALFYAIVILANKFFRNIAALDSSIAQLLLASIILLPYVIYQDNSWSMSGFSLLSLLILGVIHTGIAYLLYFSSLQTLPAQKVAIFSYLDPVTAIILSTVLLAEPMSISQWIGAILILGSLFASELIKKNN
ncbi:DMT family transporter [uncultured Megamonas sp.]|uniref:DMT family transporter n=1 Tax=uncultured Megamonas sp. TaxID=286140 RepID=UPI00266ECE45|nr:EamA family transporter [uncultured Megamonas sp.]